MIRKNMYFIYALALALVLPVSVARLSAAADHAATKTAAGNEAAAVPEKTIIFFMNPNGMPCQRQDRILRGMAAKLRGKATVKYYKTTQPADREQFYRFGVRGLPMIIVINQDGNQISRFNPGIQSAGAILAVINAK